MARNGLWGVILLILSFFLSCQNTGGRVASTTPQEIESYIRFLSDDLLEGRVTGRRGVAIAALYQENFFRGLGMEPCFGKSYRQPFALTGTLADKSTHFEVISNKQKMIFRIYKDFAMTSEREDTPEEIDSELVYGGYLIQAPEREWDDIKGTDLKGKVLLVEVNEPGNYPGGIFDGEDMTYYGRWTYKFEKASELGAAGVFIIQGSRASASWARPQFFLPDKASRLYFQGWLQEQAASQALEAAGFKREELLAQAEKPDFKPVPLGLKIRVRQKPAFFSVETDNIAALVRGRHPQRKDGYIVLSAHYDHLGRDPNREGDQIYNGAVDNCSASACLLALARYYSQCPEELRVNLVFLAPAAEEEGLLGSEYFVRHLPFADSSVLANINFEMTNVWGKTEDVYAIGGKHSDLEDTCRQAAENLGLEYIPERLGEIGYFFRSDQLSFVRGGIPGVWLHEGVTSQGEDKEYASRKGEEYRRTKYHRVIDEVEEDWDLSGTVQITDWAREIISLLSQSKDIPDFKPTSPYKREGQKSSL